MTGSTDSIALRDAEEAQQPVIDFLNALADGSLPDRRIGGDTGGSEQPGNRISTHCAQVFLCGDEVFKVKRAVSYSYLDMSTLEARRVLCERELALNRPVLPGIYLAVVTITRQADGSLEIDGSGEPVEYAVHMKRFDEALVLDNLARNDRLDDSLAGRLGQSIATYHHALSEESVADGHERIREVVVELIQELGELQSVFDRAALDAFEECGMRELAACRELLDRRAEDGFIRRCHGDLHLRNLLLHEGIPTPFDALEFDERMATTDVLYDLAFLLMDLDHRSLSSQANHTFNQYLLHSDDRNIQGLSLLPLFLFCRAGIRAMTTAQALPAADEVPATVARTESIDEARQYLALALSYLESEPPLLLAIGGVSGTGKSTQAMLLAPRIGRAPGALLLRSDVERKRALGLSETVKLPADHYTAEASRQNYTRLLARTATALDAGVSVIVDAVFLDEDVRQSFAELAEDRSVGFVGVWLSAPQEQLEQRLRDRREDASDATVPVLRRQLHLEGGNISWAVVSSTAARDQVHERIMNILQEGSAAQVLRDMVRTEGGSSTSPC